MLIQSERRDEKETAAGDEVETPDGPAAPSAPSNEPAASSPEVAVPSHEAAAPSPQAAAPRLRDLRSMRWLSAHLRSGLTAVIVLALAGGLVDTTLRLRHQDAVSHARTTALAAVQTYAVYMASYDFRRLDDDFGKVKQHSTAAFQAKFTQSSNGLVKLLTDYHATASAKVLGAGLVSADTGRAVALVFISQKVTNTAQKSTPPDTQSRLRVTMIHHNGQWLIDNVELL
jgi:Mce-associated membrane protein